MNAQVEPFIYKAPPLGFRSSLGAHRGQMAGSGQLFSRHESLLSWPDPRRLDLHASVLDPFQNYRVKIFQQHTQLPMVMVADLSASMRYQATHSRQNALADFILSAVLSAQQTGDSFSFIGCGQCIEQQWLLPARRSYGSAYSLSEKLRRTKFSGKAESLIEISPLLPSKRALILLASDFFMPLGKIKAVLAQMSSHIVVPMVFWDESEYQNLPDWGIIKLREWESGMTRTLFLRPSYKQQIIEVFDQRRKVLQQVFRGTGAEPLFMLGAYQAQTVSAYFQRWVG